MKRIFSAVGVTAAMAMSSGSSLAEEDRRMQVDQDSLRDAGAIVNGYNEGKIILFDLSSEENKEEKKAIMNDLSGMVVGDNKMVYLKKGAQGARFLVLEKQTRPEKLQRAVEKFENESSGGSRTKRSVGTAAAAAPLDESGTLRPRVNTVTLRKDDVSCMLPRYKGLTPTSDLLGLWRKQETLALDSVDSDYCDDDASMELNYQIDMFGSKIVSKVVDGRQVSTEAGKFFVVTVSPNAQAGAGWHITDDLQRRRDFSTSLAAAIPGKVRGESVGPLVNRYQFWIRKPSDTEVSLVEKFPLNVDKQVTFNESRGITAGITGSISGMRNVNSSVGGSTSNTNGSSNSNTNGSSNSNSAGTSNSTTNGTSNSTGHELYNGTAVTTGEKPSTTVTDSTKDINTNGSSNSNTSGVSGSTTSGTSNSSTNGTNTSNTQAGNFNNSTGAQVTSQLSGAVTQSNNRSLSYTGTEYTIENKSSTKIAKWVWSLRLEDDQEKICDYLVKKDLNTCFYTMPLLDTGWIINANKFSSATHANFVPAFQAVFKAMPGFAKTSTFEFGTSVELASLVGATQPTWSPALLNQPGNLVPGIDGVPTVISSLMPNVLKFSADLKTSPVQSVTESFTVDWDQPYFAPEANLRLQVISPPVSGTPETYNTMCLSANFNANTNANTNATAQLADAGAAGQAATTMVSNADAALTQALAFEAAALAEYRENTSDATRTAYTDAGVATARRRVEKETAEAAAAKAAIALRVAQERAGLATAKIPTASFEKCTDKKEQVWGYDAEEKLFKSRAVKGAEYCLAYPNLDRRLSSDDTLISTPELNAVEIWACSNLDNRQKWVLQDDGYLRSYATSDRKYLSYGVEARNAKDKYGVDIIQNGNYIVERVPHTGMSPDGTYQKKIQAFPARY